MRKLVLRISVSIDGFMEASGGNLDFSKYRSPEGAAWVAEKMEQAGAHLLGRKSFTHFASFWPTMTGPLAKVMNETPKIVFSRKGFDMSPFVNTPGWFDAKVLTGNLAEEITNLKKQPGKDLMAHGGIEFVQNLVQTGLVDEYCLAVHPVAAGKGFGLFEKNEKPIPLEFIDSKIFSTGATIQIYRAVGTKKE